MKICKDCKHYDGFGICARKQAQTDPVYGRSESLYCAAERDCPLPFDVLFRLCGKRGRYWEPKS